MESIREKDRQRVQNKQLVLAAVGAETTAGMNHPIRFLSQSAPTMKKADRPAPMPLATQKSASPGVPALTLAFLAWLATPWDSTETGSPKYRGLDLFFRLHAGPAPRWPGAVKALFWCLAAVGACLLLGRLG